MDTAVVPPDKPATTTARPSPSQPAAVGGPSQPDPPPTGARRRHGPPSSTASVTAAPALSCIESVDGLGPGVEDERDDEGSRSADEGALGGQSGSGTSEDAKEDSGGAGNETDVEDEDGVEDDSLSPPDFPPPLLPNGRLVPNGGAAMYPFSSASAQHQRRPSSLEREVMSSATSSSSLDSSERRLIGEPLHKGARLNLSKRHSHHPVPRLRRIGALGISIHSDSDPDDPNISGLDSNDRRVESSTNDTRATDLGISSNELRLSGGGASQSKKARKRRVVADATFRGIVDELAVQNRELRDRLKRYEAEGVPNDVKQDRLFEIRFFDALPPEKRCEVGDYLTRYVQEYVRVDTPSIHDDSPTHLPHDALSALPAHLRPSNIEDPSLASPSNSGLEPVSFSGTGSSMRLPPSPYPRPAALKAGASSQPAPITSPEEETKAREIVSALESLFQQSLLRTLRARTPRLPNLPELPSPDSNVQEAGSNESYLSNLLSHDFLSQGYVYLNLAFTMAQLHHFSVTVGFVQRAVRQFSSRLELSEDGNRIRWRGGGRSLIARTQPSLSTLNEDVVAETSSLTSSNQSRPLPREGREPSSKDTLVSGSSGDSSSRSGFGGTGGGGGTSLLKNSQAPSSGTGATSRFSSGSHKEATARPVRPSAAVLQPMNRLHGVQVDEAGQVDKEVDGTRKSSAPAAHVPVQPTSSRRRITSPHKQQQKDTSSIDGQSVLSAANLHEHDRLGREEASVSASADASDKAVRSPVPHAQDSFDSSDRRQSKDETSTLVFYGNGVFCTDLSKEDEPVTPPLLPVEQKLAVEADAVLGADGGKNDSDKDERAGEVSVVAETEGSDFDMLAINDVRSPLTEPSTSNSDQEGSANSSLFRLRASGMTTTIPADLFTVVVQTRHHPPKRGYPFPSPDSPQNAVNRLATSFPFFPPDAKRIRLDTYSPSEIVSTKEIPHNPRSRERVQLAGLGSMSDDSGGEGEDGFDGKRGWRCGHELTSSNLAKHARQPPPSIYIAPPAPYLPPSPSPPDDDYLLSLSAPSHSWAPHASGLHSSAASSRRSFVTSFLPGDARRLIGPLFAAPGSITGLSTGDEKPISLDEAVEMGEIVAA
ncbi:frequency clock protein [Rhodotorula toruloides]|uniref:Frequency clock protein n=1 Tax=Rhodotorula toruloides TaxID=5286 RepID=A0A511KBK2_RHOTO|nr:frequency clock protein [Rhodotorula toruloides]